ncbi:CdaR family transcriptional regulator [Allosalinactinospora lopnorensis]|uniref:CdaR family transcriptional regulator n=1 Tax=Allosalinactinospora lopnorensis TaxID=1352348 RepID=UPI000623E37C|nr:sugar diacid recognition domain-containing protein [Allosalinactinospora lopnorensis]
MLLTHSLAQEIARDTSAVIGYNVLITDDKGIVLGSGDASRVDSLHEASLDVLHTLREATHASAQAQDLRGVRAGITLPLVLGGKAVGTVGITGSPHHVRRFGQVVRRQIEILLQESATQYSQMLRERAVEDLVRDIASFERDRVDPEAVEVRARDLGYSPTLRRVAILIDVPEPAGARQRRALGADTLRPEILRTIREAFSGGQDIVAATASGRFAVLRHWTDRDAAPDTDGAVRRVCLRVLDTIAARHGHTTRAGIGGLATTVAGLHDAYQDALDALRLGRRAQPGERVHRITDLRIHQALAAMGHHPRERLLRCVPPTLSGHRDWPLYRETILAWCENGFNLIRTAAALGVHRNTVVHRLERIENLYGGSIRDHPTSLTLYLACVADGLESGAGAPSGLGAGSGG